MLLSAGIRRSSKPDSVECISNRQTPVDLIVMLDGWPLSGLWWVGSSGIHGAGCVPSAIDRPSKPEQRVVDGCAIA